MNTYKREEEVLRTQFECKFVTKMLKKHNQFKIYILAIATNFDK